MLPQPLRFLLSDDLQAEDAQKEKEIHLEQLRQEVVQAACLTQYSKQAELQEVENQRVAWFYQSAGNHFQAEQHNQMANQAWIRKERARNKSLNKMEYVQEELQKMAFHHHQQQEAEPQETLLLQEELNQLRAFAHNIHEPPRRGNLAFLQDNQTPVVPATAPITASQLATAINASIQPAMQHNRTPVVDPATTAPITALQLARAINASIHPAMQERPPLVDAHFSSEASSTSNTWSSSSSRPLDCGPSAPPIFADGIIEYGPIHYPSVDSSPNVDMSSPTVGIESVPARASDEKEDDASSSSCIICLDAPVNAACVPCGHMVGCMSCLNEIKAAKGTCPVCRAKIQNVLRVYTV